MFRVFDLAKNCYVREGFYLSPNGDLYMSKKTLFGTEKLSLVSSQRYVYQVDTGLYDENKVLIFEGDICRIESLNAIGVIAYIPELASYCLLDDKELKYYPLGEERCKQLKIISNVFENEKYSSTEENSEV